MNHTQRNRCQPSNDWTAVHEPGEIVLADCRNSLEDRNSTGKLRPMVVIRREEGHVRAVGLTTNPAFRNGVPRVAIPNPQAVGLYKPGFLWGDRVTRVHVLDVEKHIGWADEALVDAILASVDLCEDDRIALGEVA